MARNPIVKFLNMYTALVASNEQIWTLKKRYTVYPKLTEQSWFQMKMQLKVISKIIVTK